MALVAWSSFRRASKAPIPLWVKYCALVVSVLAAYPLVPQPAKTSYFVFVSALGCAATFLGVKINRPPARSAWHCVTIYLALATAGNFVLVGYQFDFVNRDLHLASGLHLLGLGIAAVALIRFTERRPFLGDAIMDTALIVIGLILPWLMFSMRGTFSLGHASGTGAFGALAFPALDLMILAMGFATFWTLRKRPPAAYLLLAAAVVRLIADSFFASWSFGNSYSIGSTFDWLWFLSYMIPGIALLHPSIRDLIPIGADAGPIPQRVRITWFGLSLFTGVATLAVASTHGFNTTSWVVLIACGAQIGLILYRSGRLTSDLDSTIEALKVNQARLEQSADEHRSLRSQYQALLEEVPAVAYTAEPGARGSWLYVSPKIESMTGFQSDNWIEDRDFWFSHLHPEDQQRVAEQERLSELSLSPMRIEYRLMTNGGDEIWVRDEAVPIDRDGVILMQGFMTDITAEKQAQAQTTMLQAELQQAQKMEAIGQLAGGIAHDFNNLLAVVINYCGLLYDEVDDAALKADLDEVLMAARRGADLTRQLLTFSRHQMSTQEVMNINDVVTGMEKMLRRVIPENIRLSLELDPSLRSCVADMHEIEQIIMNLSLNAKDAMEMGGTLKIKTSNDDSISLEPRVALLVSDNGHGLSDEVKQQIFQPFFTTKEIGAGTGLGLAVVYGIVERAGGSIKVTSEPGAGTDIKILLPASDRLATGQPMSGAPNAPGGKGEQILVVENEDAVRDVTTRILTRAGYRVIAAASGEAAILTVMQGGKPDLLLTDIVMPGISGWELARQINATTLYMSGYPLDESDHEAHCIVSKPFENDELLSAVAQALGRSEAPVLAGGKHPSVSS